MKGFRSRLRFSFLAVGKTCESRRMDGGGRDDRRNTEERSPKQKGKRQQKKGVKYVKRRNGGKKKKENKTITKETQIAPRQKQGNDKTRARRWRLWRETGAKGKERKGGRRKEKRGDERGGVGQVPGSKEGAWGLGVGGEGGVVP